MDQRSTILSSKTSLQPLSWRLHNNWGGIHVGINTILLSCLRSFEISHKRMTQPSTKQWQLSRCTRRYIYDIKAKTTKSNNTIHFLSIEWIQSTRMEEHRKSPGTYKTKSQAHDEIQIDKKRYVQCDERWSQKRLRQGYFCALKGRLPYMSLCCAVAWEQVRRPHKIVRQQRTQVWRDVYNYNRSRQPAPWKMSSRWQRGEKQQQQYNGHTWGWVGICSSVGKREWTQKGILTYAASWPITHATVPTSRMGRRTRFMRGMASGRFHAIGNRRWLSWRWHQGGQQGPRVWLRWQPCNVWGLILLNGYLNIPTYCQYSNLVWIL